MNANIAVILKTMTK